MPDVGELVGRLTADELNRGERRTLLLALTRALAAQARAAGARAAVTGRLLVDVVTDDVAPRLPVRDLLTLREHHGGLSGDALAQALVSQAARTTAAIGAAAGALAAVEMVAPPTLLAAPVQLVAGTLAVVAVEIKLVAELHVVYGRVPRGSRRELAAAYLDAWASRRAVDGAAPGPSLSTVLAAAARHRLRQRLVLRLARNVSSLAPFLAGAVAGAELNRRETRALGAALLRGLHPRT